MPMGEGYVQLFTPTMGVIAIYMVVKVETEESEGQSDDFKRFQVMLQTLLDREYKLEEINKSILANFMEWERGKYFSEDTPPSSTEFSSPQEKIVEEKISNTRKGDVEEMLRRKTWRSEHSGKVLIKRWEED
ncbi:hypothetical protein HAX54_046069 [Datura stramonium]|uniref:Uncharacterized protein n=1 Tax=Datura stramonium TaxID=4076 RepID=A0ABS8SRF7_DATST|nr:hypothetical protein [Datura stramonium]